MNAADTLRDAVGGELAALCSVGQPLDTNGRRSTGRLYSTFDSSRSRYRRSIYTEYLAGSEEPTGSGSAIITAGVPGAGKSTMLRRLVQNLDAYRVLDADVIKVNLIEDALRAGIYDDLRAHILADGRGIAPMELAPLVHNESIQLIDAIRDECVRRRESIVIEGTLLWEPHAAQLYRQLAAADYELIVVLALEVEQAIAQEQALRRWWQGREEWRDGRGMLGGRFTPPAAISAGYDGQDFSRCTRHADTIIEAAQIGAVDAVAVKTYKPADGGQFELLTTKSWPT